MKKIIASSIQKLILMLNSIKYGLYKSLLHFKGEYAEFTILQRWYLNGLIIFATYFIWRSFDEETALGVWYTGIAFWLFAVCIDWAGIYKKIYETSLGKLLIIISLTLATNLAIGIAGQEVNDIAGTEPTKFPLTIALISILAIPFFISILLSIGFFVGIALSMLVFAFHTIDEKNRKVIFPGYVSNPEIKKFKKLTTFVRFISFLIICNFAYSWSQDKENTHAYGLFLKDSATSFLYQFELYSRLPCDLNANDKAVFLSENSILVGTKNGEHISFSQRECNSIAN